MWRAWTTSPSCILTTTVSKTWALPWRRWHPSRCWTSAATSWQRWQFENTSCPKMIVLKQRKSFCIHFHKLPPGPGGSSWTPAPALHGVQRHRLSAREFPEPPDSAAVCEDGTQPADRQGHPAPHLQRDRAGGAGPELQQARKDPSSQRHAAAPLPAGQPDQRSVPFRSTISIYQHALSSE